MPGSLVERPARGYGVRDTSHRHSGLGLLGVPDYRAGRYLLGLHGFREPVLGCSPSPLPPRGRSGDDGLRGSALVYSRPRRLAVRGRWRSAVPHVKAPLVVVERATGLCKGGGLTLVTGGDRWATRQGTSEEGVGNRLWNVFVERRRLQRTCRRRQGLRLPSPHLKPESQTDNREEG